MYTPFSMYTYKFMCVEMAGIWMCRNVTTAHAKSYSMGRAGSCAQLYRRPTDNYGLPEHSPAPIRNVRYNKFAPIRLCASGSLISIQDLSFVNTWQFHYTVRNICCFPLSKRRFCHDEVDQSTYQCQGRRSIGLIISFSITFNYDDIRMSLNR